MNEFTYPKERRANLEWRADMLRRAKTDLGFRLATKELFHRDILFAYNAFFYTLDVRKRPYHNLPFCTWEYQNETIVGLAESIATGRDEVWEKTRDMGATWMVLCTYLWYWLKPEGGTDFLLGSRIEDYVDKKGDMRALFPKVRYALYKLPQWLRPKGFSPRRHDNHMKLENPETGSTMIGESNNANYSTGGRFLSILYDEFAKWEGTDENAWTAGGDASPSRIAVSTPFGVGGQYYTLVNNGKTLKRTLHWKLHPEKAVGVSCTWPPPNDEDKERLGENYKPRVHLTSPWYEAQKARRSAKEVRQELDISYEGSGNPVFEGKAMDALQFYRSIPDIPKYFGKIDLVSKTIKFEKPFEDQEGYLIIYRPYKKGKQYTVGTDVVEGIEEGDFAVVTVFERDTKCVAAVYWSRIDEVNLASVVKAIQDYYSLSPGHHTAPWVGIETNGPGLATFDYCVSFNMPNLFMAPRYDVSVQGVSYKKGWKTDTASRPELVAGIKAWLMAREGEINNHRLIGECFSFVYSKTGKPQAKAGAHDDMVISLGIAIQLDQLTPKFTIEEQKETSRDDYTDPDWESLKVDEPKTIHDYCMAQALREQAERTDTMVQQRLFMEDMLDGMMQLEVVH